MLVSGSYLTDVEKILEALKKARKSLIREGLRKVFFARLLDLCVRLYFSFSQENEYVQYILSAATLPTYGTKSVENSALKMFRRVRFVVS